MIGSPIGGSYSGSGVSGTLFDPATAVIGTHTVYYDYTDATSGCSSIDSISVIVTGCLALNELSNTNIKVYPNPSNGIILISFEGVMANYTLMNNSGKTLLSDKISSMKIIDLSTFSNGIYFIKISIENETYTEKLIIQ